MNLVSLLKKPKSLAPEKPIFDATKLLLLVSTSKTRKEYKMILKCDYDHYSNLYGASNIKLIATSD